MTKVLTAHVPLELSSRIDALAARLQRSRGWIVKQALAEWAERQESQAKPASGFAEAKTEFDFASAGHVAADAAAALKSLRKSTTLGDVSWRELRDAGRR